MDINNAKNNGVIKDFLHFLWQRKAWWIIPIVVVLAVVAFLLVLMQSNYISPFIYAL